ncbi:MAG: hypothetical protein AB7K68_14080 [Bacteriovoracia bacterium]
MKKIASSLALLALLYGCSSSEVAPETAPLPHPDEAAAAISSPPPAADAAVPTDGLLAPDPAAPTAATASESQSVDSLLATPVEGGSGSVSANPSPESTLSSPVVSTPPPPVSDPVPAPRLSIDHEVAPTPVMPTAKADPRKRDTYEAYEEYRQKEASRKQLQESYDDRQLFPHEGGNWQVGIDYVRNAYDGKINNFRSGAFDATSQGGQLSFTYFPLKDLSYGAFGIGPVGSVVFTRYKYSSATIPGEFESTKKRSMYSYGARAIYEFDYWLGQLVVPFALFDYQKVKLTSFERTAVNVAVPSQSFDSQCYGAGAHLNLNRLEGASASRGLANLGIRKTYLTYTFVNELQSSGGSGTHALGLRFEY